MSEVVLLVDDEEGIRKVLGISLSDLGFKVHTAGNGKEALAAFSQVKPSIVLTDIKMPGMDGISLLKEIKNINSETEVIMLTGHGDMNLAIKSLKHDAIDFITKPIYDEALEIALKRACERIEMKRRIKDYTLNLEQMVAEKSRQLLDAERLAAVGETVAGLSHAIKNITGGLEGGMFVLEKGIELENKEFLEKGWKMVGGNVDRIKKLSLDLLNFAKADQMEYKEIDPKEIVKDVFDLMKPKAEENGIDFIVDLDETVPMFRLDTDGIHRCLLNLVTNAIDACIDTDPCGKAQTIILKLRRSGSDHLEFQVEDTCGGMEKALQEKMFQRFFTTKGKQGTGIGLMLTKKIVGRHNGTVSVQSKKGGGSCFTISIPPSNSLVSD